jgi:dihydrofolate synthase/folylpolyglutamate synthase
MPLPSTWDYERALAFLVGRIDYERWTAVPYDDAGFKLDRMRTLIERLGRPDRALQIVHVAGTKGKGSTAAMISAALTAAGYRTGTFTSPHLERIEERIALDGVSISAARFAELVGEIAVVAEQMDREAGDGQGPTYFELTAAIALVYFQQAGAAWTVLEVGLGGRLDCTNVCEPRVSVITSISFDHMKQLGHTLALIAAEKAGIIKPGVPVVSGVTAEEPRDVIRAVARANNSQLSELGRDFSYEFLPPPASEPFQPGAIDFAANSAPKVRFERVQLALTGRHQAGNAAVALATLLELRAQGLKLDDAALRSGLANAKSAARIEVVGRRPWVVLDVAHNEASAAALAECLAAAPVRGTRWLILAVSKDKDVPAILRGLAPAFDRLIATKFTSNPRGLEPEQLAQLARECGFTTVECADDLETAWNRVRERAGPDDLICGTGSFFLAGELRPVIAGAPVGKSG